MSRSRPPQMSVAKESGVARITRLISDNLEADSSQNLFRVVDIEPRKDSYGFRMPENVDAFNLLWVNIARVCSEHNIRAKRLKKYATLDELDEIMEDISWLWHDWLPRGMLSLLVGDPGGGKSMAALDWARTVTNGTCWPFCKLMKPNGQCGDSKQRACKPGNVVWIEAESGHKILIDRARSLNVKKDHIFLPTFGIDLFAQPDMTIPEHQEYMTNMIDAKKPALVVVDSLGGASSGGENRIEEVRPMLQYFASIAQEKNTTVLVIHHLRKQSVNEDIAVTLSRIRGSTAISAFARTIIALERNHKGAMLSVIKSNIGRPPNPLMMVQEYDSKDKLVGIEYELFTAPPAKKTRVDSCTEWAWDILENHDGKISFVELLHMAEEAGYNKNLLYGARTKLVNQITVTGTGREVFWEASHDGGELANIANALSGNGHIPVKIEELQDGDPRP